MNHIRGLTLLGGGTLCFGLFLACGSYEDPGFNSKEQHLEKGQLVDAPIRENSLFKKHNLPTGTWKVWGQIPLAESWEKPLEVSVVEDDDEPDQGDHVASNEPMVMIDEKGTVYSAKFSDDELALITRVLEAEGLQNGRVGDDGGIEPNHDEDAPKAWAHGTDNRSVLGLNEYPISSSGDAVLYQRIGQVGSGCSGTLVGTPETDYYYLTAAHCIFSDAGNYTAPKFYPRRDSCQNKLGSSLSSCDTKPYGEWTSGGAYTYEYFVENCSSSDDNYGDTCASYDIAIVRVSKPSGESFPGAFGFGSYSNSFIKDRTNYIRGYPNCGQDGDPDDSGGCASPTSVCRNNTLYGASGDMGDTYNSGRRSKFGIDISRGQSGSGIYLNDGGNHRVFAVLAAENTGCFDGCNQIRPNHGARITSTFYGYMLAFMGI